MTYSITGPYQDSKICFLNKFLNSTRISKWNAVCLNEIIKSFSIWSHSFSRAEIILISELNTGACKILIACVMHNYPNHSEFHSNLLIWAKSVLGLLSQKSIYGISGREAKDKMNLSGVKVYTDRFCTVSISAWLHVHIYNSYLINSEISSSTSTFNPNLPFTVMPIFYFIASVNMTHFFANMMLAKILDNT